MLFVNSNVSVIPRFHTSVLKTSGCPAVSRNTTSWEGLISFVYGAMTSQFVLLTWVIEQRKMGGRNNIKTALKEGGWQRVVWIFLAQLRRSGGVLCYSRSSYRTKSIVWITARDPTLCRSPYTASRLNNIWRWQCVSVNSPNMSPCACGRTDVRMWRSK